MQPVPASYYRPEIWTSLEYQSKSSLQPISIAPYSCSDEHDDFDDGYKLFFGGDAGDEAGELCGPMLQVLLDLDLFDGA